MKPFSSVIFSISPWERAPITRLLIAGFLYAGISTMAIAQSRTGIDIESLGPQVGEQIPEFTLPDQQGRQQTLESIKGPNGTMLLFHRSASW
jgi:hypothetical protein